MSQKNNLLKIILDNTLKPLLQKIYNVNSINEENLPKKNGTLMLANHLSFIDAFILAISCKRPIRYLIAKEYYHKPITGKVPKAYKAIPISVTNAKNAITQAQKYLKKGELVCIFPEGRISRNGLLHELQRGYQLIVPQKKTIQDINGNEIKLIPVYLGAFWFTIFSNWQNKFFLKKPALTNLKKYLVYGKAKTKYPTSELQIEFLKLSKKYLSEKIKNENTLNILKNKQRFTKNLYLLKLNSQNKLIKKTSHSDFLKSIYKLKPQTILNYQKIIHCNLLSDTDSITIYTNKILNKKFKKLILALKLSAIFEKKFIILKKQKNEQNILKIKTKHTSLIYNQFPKTPTPHNSKIGYYSQEIGLISLQIDTPIKQNNKIILKKPTKLPNHSNLGTILNGSDFSKIQNHLHKKNISSTLSTNFELLIHN